MLKDEISQSVVTNLHDKEKIELEAIFASSPDGITVVDLNGNITECNEATVRLHGFTSREELIGKSAFELISPKDRQRAAMLLQEMPKRKVLRNLEIIFLTKDGKEFPGEGSGKVLIDATGNPVGFVTITRDATERKKAEEALRKSEERFKELANALLDIVFETDLTGRVTFFNRRALEITGYAREELEKGVNMLQFVAPDDKERAKINMKRSMGGEDLGANEYKLLKRDGSIFQALVKTAPIVNENRAVGLRGVVVDITELKKAEKALQESEGKLRGIIDASPDPIAVSSPDAKIVDCNLAGLNRFGYLTKSEVVGRSVYDFFAERTGTKAVERLSRAGDEVRNVEVIFQTKDGVEFPGELSTSPIRSPSGEVTSFVSAIRDITERKEKEKKLRESEQRFEQVAESAEEWIWEVDANGTYTYSSPMVEKILGYTPEEIIGKKHFYDLFHAEDQEQLRKAALAAFEQKQPFRRFVNRNIHKNGKTVWLSTSGSPILDPQGKLVGYRGVDTDITDLKKKELELKDERHKLDTITQSIGAGFVVISKDYHVLWANKFIRDYKGDVEGKLCFATLNSLPDVCPDCGVKKVFENGVDFDSHEYSSIDIRGKPYWVEIVATPIKDETGNVVSAVEIALDITEKKNLQGELAQYSMLLEKLVEERTKELKETQAKLVKSERLAAIGESAAMVGHDLRNPLQAIKNATYYLNNTYAAMHPPSLDPKVRKSLQVISDSVNYADKIVRDLHDFSTMRNPLFRKTNLNSLLRETLQEISKPENVRILTHFSLRQKVEMDRDQMKRVFFNLITNGFQAMNGGTLTVSTRKVDSCVEVSFKDTGIGITTENMQKLFQPFFTTKAKGMGVGLAICKKFVENHNGKINVESKIGKGTTFTIELPVTREKEVQNVGKKED
jgi:PAS domain S-box-containing protein